MRHENYLFLRYRSSRTAWLVLWTALLPTGIAQAQTAPKAGGQPGNSFQSSPIQPATADPAIMAALKQVSPDRIKADIAKLVSFGNRSSLSSLETGLPAGTGAPAAADWIEAEFKRISAACGGCLEVKRDDFVEPAVEGAASRIPKPTKMTNIYAVLHGKDPAQADRRVLVTGHYDSRNTNVLNARDPAPGANDDASGVAVSLECARVLSTLKLPATVVFVAVVGEEQGLVGSRHLARLAKSEGWRLEAVLNNDIVGGDTTPGDTGQDKTAVRIFSEGVPGPATLDQLHQIQAAGAESDSPSRELARAILDISQSYFANTLLKAPATPGQPHSNLIRNMPAFHPVLEFRRDRYGRGGDHTSFNLEGFTAVRFTEWRENYNHQHQNLRVENGVQYGDLIDYVDPGYVANVARLNAAALATLASAPGAPQNVRMMPTAGDNDSELLWDPPAGMPADATYEVVWRATADPTWTTFVSTGRAPRIKLPVSKDNVAFGVRAVDSAGHRSIAVFPTAARNQVPGLQ